MERAETNKQQAVQCAHPHVLGVDGACHSRERSSGVPLRSAATLRAMGVSWGTSPRTGVFSVRRSVRGVRLGDGEACQCVADHVLLAVHPQQAPRTDADGSRAPRAFGHHNGAGTGALHSVWWVILAVTGALFVSGVVPLLSTRCQCKASGDIAQKTASLRCG